MNSLGNGMVKLIRQTDNHEKWSPDNIHIKYEMKNGNHHQKAERGLTRSVQRQGQ